MPDKCLRASSCIQNCMIRVNSSLKFKQIEQLKL